MNFNLFACSDGGYLVTPECMLASSRAQALHGPVQRFLGVVDCALFPEDVRLRVEADVELHAYAFVEQHAGDQMLAIRRTVRASGEG
jgi:hypothetical protein